MSYSTEAKLLIIHLGLPVDGSLPKAMFVDKLHSLLEADQVDINIVLPYIELPRERVSLMAFYKILQYFNHLPAPMGRSTLIYIASVLRNPWFHGFLKPVDIATRLQNKPAGAFLVSFHDQYVGVFKLSVVSGIDEISNFSLYYNTLDRIECTTKDTYSVNRTYASFDELVSEHKQVIFRKNILLDKPCNTVERNPPSTVERNDMIVENEPLVDNDNNNTTNHSPQSNFEFETHSNYVMTTKTTDTQPLANNCGPQESTQVVLRAPPKPEAPHTAKPTENAVYYGDLAESLFRTQSNSYRQRISWEEFVLRTSEKLRDPTMLDIPHFTEYMNILKPYLVDKQLQAVTKAKVEHFFKFFPQLTATKTITSNKASTTIVEITKLLAQKWFHGLINADEAERRLFGRVPGTFLLRFSASVQAHVTVSLVGFDGRSTYNYRYQILGDGMVAPELPPSGDADTWTNKKSFHSIDALVSYYATPGNHIWDSGVSLLYYVPKPEQLV
jgi:hypothetical protein